MITLFIDKPTYGKSLDGHIVFKVQPNGKDGIQITLFSKKYEIHEVVLHSNTYECDDATMITRKEFLDVFKATKKAINSIRA